MKSIIRQKKILKKRQRIRIRKQKRKQKHFLKKQKERVSKARPVTHLGKLLCGKSFPYFPGLFLSKYLSWKDFVNMRSVCKELCNIVDSVDSKWMQFFQKNYLTLIPSNENEWNIFFPTIRLGCFRDLTLDVTKILHLNVPPIILQAPEVGGYSADAITAYTFPWYYVCKFLDLPITSECCHDFAALRSIESYVRLDNTELDEYAPLCVYDFLKKYALKETKTISFISRCNPGNVPKFNTTNLPIKRKNGPIGELCAHLPEMLAAFPKGRQLAFTLFVKRSTQNYEIWLSRLNANSDLVQAYQEQLYNYASSHYG